MGRNLLVFKDGIELRVSVPAAGWDGFELGGQKPAEHPVERAFVVRERTVMAVELRRLEDKPDLDGVTATGRDELVDSRQEPPSHPTDAALDLAELRPVPLPLCNVGTWPDLIPLLLIGVVGPVG